MILKWVVLTLFVGAVAAPPISANDMPMMPSGLEILIPTQIANLHAATTHVIVIANLSGEQSTNVPVGYGRAVAEVNSGRSIDEDLLIAIETASNVNPFTADHLNIQLYLCGSAPIEHLDSGELMEHYTFMDANIWTQHPICFEANGPNGPNYSYIENWDNTSSYIVPRGELIKQ